MDTFHSEPITSDSSTCQGDPIPQIQKKARTRKTRRTEDLISLNTLKPLQQENSEPIGKIKRQNISFLPKIDLVEDVGRHTVTKTSTFIQNRPSLAKKTAVFKIGRSMIEGKQFQSRKKPSTSKSKFPKIFLKLTSTEKNKEKRKKSVERKSMSKVRKSDELVQVLANAATELLSGSAITVMDSAKRKSKSLSRKGAQDSSGVPQMLLKDIYVKLIPLEETDLLNEDQLRQLKVKENITSLLPLHDVNFNQLNSGSSRSKTRGGKENRYKAETPKASKLPAKHPATSVDRIKKSCYRNSMYHEKIVPCKVVLERLTLEQIQLLTLPKQSNISVTALPKKHNLPCNVIVTNQESYNADEFVNQNTYIDLVDPVEISLSNSNTSIVNTSISGAQKYTKTLEPLAKSRLSKSIEKSNKPMGNCEESFFNPADSSSPLVSLQKSALKLNDSNKIPFVSSSPNRRLTYELEENETKFVHSEDLMSDAELENGNGTYEVEAGSLTRSSKIRKDFEELPRFSVCNSERNAVSEPSTSTKKSQRKSRRSSTKNGTYELTKSTDDVSIQKPTESFNNGSGKDATFEIDASNHSKTHKSIQSGKHSNSYECVLTRSEGGKRRRSCNSEIGVPKKRRSNSCDAVRVDISGFYLLENTQESEKQQNTSTPDIPKKRRSTLTLEDSINDVALLKSVCDSSGTPQKLSKTGKDKSQTLVQQVLDNKSMSSRLDYSNITTRKHSLSYSQSIRDSSKKRKSIQKSAVGLESISPPWSHESNSSDDSFEINETDADSLPKQVRRSVAYKDLIEVSDEEDKEEESSSATTSSESSDSDDEKQLPKQGRKVAFETNSLKKRKSNLPKVSFAGITTPKPMIKHNTSDETVVKNRRVTFSEMSVIIVDDSSTSDGSPERKSSGALVPTIFPSDDDESSDELPQFNKRGAVGCTPIQRRVESTKLNRESTPGQSPRISSTTVGRTPIQLQSRVNTPQFTKRTVGRTPLHLKIPLEESNISCASPKFNKRISSRERVRIQNDSLATSINKSNNSNTASKKTKMPDFASIHKRMYDKMLNLEQYSKRKDERAKLLLSGHKPAKVGSSLKKSASKQLENNLHEKVSSKKQLKYEEPSTSAALPKKHQVCEKAPLVTSTPKGKKNEQGGYTRYGFKLENHSVTKKEQVMAVANKTRPCKSKTAEHRTEIKGVRSNRRFDLLMKMRQKTQK